MTAFAKVNCEMFGDVGLLLTWCVVKMPKSTRVRMNKATESECEGVNDDSVEGATVIFVDRLRRILHLPDSRSVLS